MLNIKISSLIGIIVIFGLFFMSGVTAQPTANIISVEPEEPTIDSDFTVTANFSWNNISSVNLTVQPCGKDFCFNDFWTTAMIETNGAYSGTVKLDKENAVYIKYDFEVVAEGVTYSIEHQESWNVTLNLTDGNNTGTNGDSNNNGDSNTPGFELIFLLVGLLVIVFFVKRKR